MKIIECVPNFSEGIDSRKIKEITDVIESVSYISLLDIDPGMIKLEECKETDFDQLIGSESS